MKNPEKKITKKNLRTLTKNGGAHKLRNSTRIVKYGAINFARNIWLSAAASLIMTVTLLILFITVIASVILSETADVMRDKIDITIYFKPQTSVETLAELSKIMSADPNVKSVETSTSEKEYLRFIEENASNTELISTLDDPDMKEIMLSTMNSTMSVKVYDLDNLDSIRNLVAANELFIKNVDNEKEATYDENRSEISTITSWANIAKNGGIILGAVFLGISILVIFNTIRMAIFSRREEIYMMKLVGADRGFIKGPFLVEAQLSGILSGIIAATIGYFGFCFLEPKLTAYGIDVSTIMNILESNKLVLVYLVMSGGGMLIGTISANLAVHKYLRRASH